ncbi:E3 ubiquitin-protein ligase RING1-like [Senna tora]|uniref:E3 ubiquitin-protein ligase RING1-like n=1 Tax=Senna tora TaxID=362788 RepID=A0A834WHH0_9FABA|nr:E3 ubiquitin-protein ligase RING1-like [Senna tora]
MVTSKHYLPYVSVQPMSDDEDREGFFEPLNTESFDICFKEIIPAIMAEARIFYDARINIITPIIPLLVHSPLSICVLVDFVGESGQEAIDSLYTTEVKDNVNVNNIALDHVGRCCICLEEYEKGAEVFPLCLAVMFITMIVLFSGSKQVIHVPCVDLKCPFELVLARIGEEGRKS